MSDFSPTDVSGAVRRYSRRLVGRRREGDDVSVPALYTPSPTPKNRRSIHLDFTPATPKRASVVPRRSFIPERIPVPNRAFLVGIGVFLLLSALFKAFNLITDISPFSMLEEKESVELEASIDNMEPAIEPIDAVTDSLPSTADVIPPRDIAQVVALPEQIPPPCDIPVESLCVPPSEFEVVQKELSTMSLSLQEAEEQLRVKIDPSECKVDETEFQLCVSSLAVTETSLVSCLSEQDALKHEAASIIHEVDSEFAAAIGKLKQEHGAKEAQLIQEKDRLENSLSIAFAEIQELQDKLTDIQSNVVLSKSSIVAVVAFLVLGLFSALVGTLLIQRKRMHPLVLSVAPKKRVLSSQQVPSQECVAPPTVVDHSVNGEQLTRQTSLIHQYEAEIIRLRTVLAEAQAMNKEITAMMHEVIADTSNISTSAHSSPGGTSSRSSLSEKLESSLTTPIRVEIRSIDDSVDRRPVFAQHPTEFFIASPASRRNNEVTSWLDGERDEDPTEFSL